MESRAIRTLLGIGLLLLSIVLAARGAALVAAAPLPVIATPTSAHVALEMSYKVSDAATGENFEATIRGEGDYDNAKPAAQVTYQMQLPPDLAGSELPDGEVTIAMVAIGDRLYILDPTTQEWTWSEMPAELMTQQFAPDFSTLHADLGDSDIEFNPVGAEEVNGVPTTRWHMEFDFAKLFSDPDLMPEASEPIPPMIITYDLWIGDADSYVHRVATGMNFSMPEEDGQGGSFAMTMVMTYSNFDQPVEIVAPADAAPTTDDETPDFAAGLVPSLSTMPFGGAALSLPGGGSTASLPADPSASPAPRTNRGGIVVATAEPTAAPRPSPTPTVAATATATALPPTPPPTATPAVVANASIPPTVAVQPQTAAAPAAQEPAAAPTARSNSFPLLLGVAGLAALLVLSGGLIVAGKRMK
jgi:hypothetical protein